QFVSLAAYCAVDDSVAGIRALALDAPSVACVDSGFCGADVATSSHRRSRRCGVGTFVFLLVSPNTARVAGNAELPGWVLLRIGRSCAGVVWRNLLVARRVAGDRGDGVFR